MYIDLSQPLGTSQLNNGNILHEYQITDILIYIEFHQNNHFLSFHQKIKKNFEHDYKNIPIINQFAHQLFCIQNPKYKQLIENINTNITCLKVYSFRYYINKEYTEYDCFINYNFIEQIDKQPLYNDLCNILDETAILLKYANGIIKE